VVFSHGWPLTADAWDGSLQFVADHGFRAIAHDRRGGGRSDQPWEGNDLDHYADDLAAVIDFLDLHDVVLVGHSTGGGEVTRYVGRHGTSRVAKMVLLGAIPPLMLQTPANPEGLPIGPFNEIREGVLANRSQYYRDLAYPFYGANRDGSTVSQGARDAFWLMSMTVGIKGAYDCIKAFSETDLTEDLEKIDVPTLILHGTADNILPIDATARPFRELLPQADYVEIDGAPHGLLWTHGDEVNEALLAFLAKK
jgi:non-heme chloroperoxidase